MMLWGVEVAGTIDEDKHYPIDTMKNLFDSDSFSWFTLPFPHW